MKTQWYFPIGLLTAALAGLLPLTAADPTPVEITVTSDHIDFLAARNLVGRYQFAAATETPLAKPHYHRSSSPKLSP